MGVCYEYQEVNSRATEKQIKGQLEIADFDMNVKEA
jgi:hypothetical protein